MNAEEMFLKAGGATALLLLLHFRLNRMEQRIDRITDSLNIPRQNRRKFFRVLSLLVVASLLTVCGCAYNQHCTSPGVCETHFGIDTNAVPLINAIGDAADKAR